MLHSSAVIISTWSPGQSPRWFVESTSAPSAHQLTHINSSFAAFVSSYNIKAQSSEEHVAEGRAISLVCNYEGSISNIQWYRQQQRSRPEFLLYITEGGTVNPTASGFSAHIDKIGKSVALQISSAAVTDSAVYYCALSPTATGNQQSVYKNTAPSSWKPSSQQRAT